VYKGLPAEGKLTYLYTDICNFKYEEPISKMKWKMLGKDSIIAGYQEVSPLADGWQHRVSVHQFHMVLVHADLYSGNYVPQALTLARRLRGDAERSRQPVRIRAGLAS